MGEPSRDEPVLDTLSVLFTDLVGSTELRSRIGEDAAEVVRRSHDGLIAEVVAGHGGRVVKGLGDGFLCTFGSAARAVSAAVAIQQAVGQQRLGEPNVSLSVRIGISLGDVTVEADDVFGTPVIEASRLCSAAAGGQILAAALVASLARGRVDQSFTPVGDLELKGLAEPMPTVEVGWAPIPQGEDEVPFPAALQIREGTFPFHGRDEPMELLRSAWKHAVHDSVATSVLVAGEPGMGKTRLAAEFAKSAYDRGATVLFGRCDEELGAAYQPFAEAVSHFAVSLPRDQVDRLGNRAVELSRLDPTLRDRFTDLGAPVSTGDAEVDQFRLFEAVDGWLRTAGGESGVVFVIDDLHWAAKPTLLMLRHVLRSSAAGGPLMIVATYRDTDLDRTHPLAELLADLRRVAGIERLALSGLDRSGIEELMAAVNGTELDDEGRELAAAVHAETEGNPFFVGEVFRHLAESGALVHDGTRWVAATSVAEMSIPDGVREVVGRRLSRLSDATNEVLAWAAVVGRDLRLDVLALVAGGDERCLDALDEAVDARLVDEAGVGRWRFAHALVRATLLAELRTTRRVRMHLAVGEAYEQVAPDDAAALAQHFAEAATLGAGDKAVRYLLAAGAGARAALGFDQATRLYRQALEVIDDVGLDAPDLRAHALVGLAISGRWSAQVGIDHRASLLEACDAADDLGDGELMAQALLESSRGFVAEVFVFDEEVVRRLERCLELLPASDSRERALVMASLSNELIYSGWPLEEIESRSAEALQVARRVGDPDALASALVARWGVVQFPDLLGDGPEMAAELEVIGAQASEATRCTCGLSIAAYGGWAGDRERFRRGLEMAAESVEAASPAARWLLPAVQVGYELRFGDLATAEERAEAVLRHATETGEADAAVWYLNVKGFTLREQGRLDEWIELYRPFCDGDDYVAEVAGTLLAVALCEAERHDEARTLAPRYFRFGRLQQRDTSFLPAIGAVAVCAAELDARDEAAWLVAQLEPLSGLWSTWAAYGPVAPVTELVGRLRATLGDAVGAEAAFEDAISHCRAIQSNYFLADALLHQGRLRQDRGGDAGTPLREALALARAGGYATIARRAEATLERL